MSNALQIERNEDRILIRFARPEIRNPLSIFVVEELIAIIANLGDDRTVGMIDFTGTGNVFASGADLREIANVSTDTAKEFAEKGQQLMNLIAEIPHETRALINGVCYGGALDLSLACGKRIANSQATFCHPGAALGIITGWGGTQRLTRLIGTANACEMFFTAEPVSADRALSMGLIDSIDDQLFQ